MANRFRWAMASVCTLALGACGGGGGGTTTATATTTTDLVGKYVGKWSTACSGPATITATGAISSSKQTVTITKVSDSTYSATGGSVDYVGAGCTGTGTAVVGETGTTVFTVVGTKTATGTATSGGSGEVDKVTYPASGAGATGKDIIYVNAGGPTLQRGDTGGAKDADGFPNALLAQRYAKE